MAQSRHKQFASQEMVRLSQRGDALGQAAPDSRISGLELGNHLANWPPSAVTMARAWMSANMEPDADAILEAVDADMEPDGHRQPNQFLDAHDHEHSIMEEVAALIDEGRASSICEALEMLLSRVRGARDPESTRRKRRIVTTQKFNNCRHSRQSRD